MYTCYNYHCPLQHAVSIHLPLPWYLVYISWTLCPNQDRPLIRIVKIAQKCLAVGTKGHICSQSILVTYYIILSLVGSMELSSKGNSNQPQKPSLNVGNLRDEDNPILVTRPFPTTTAPPESSTNWVSKALLKSHLCILSSALLNVQGSLKSWNFFSIDNPIRYKICALAYMRWRPPSSNLNVESRPSLQKYLRFTSSAVPSCLTFPSNVMISITLSSCVKFPHFPTGSVFRMVALVSSTVTSSVW